MAALIIFLALYALVTMWFFVALMRWTIRSQRRCACGGAMREGAFSVLHGTRMCYPSAEALSLR
jgi:hypothetical protein